MTPDPDPAAGSAPDALSLLFARDAWADAAASGRPDGRSSEATGRATSERPSGASGPASPPTLSDAELLGGASGPAFPPTLTDAELLALYAPADRATPSVRVNFISSVDGSATAEGLSGALGAPADKRVFDLQRQLCDVVLVGAGTARAEGYGALRVGADARRWRVAQGLPEHPSFALVSGRLDLDPASDIFAQAPVRPLVLTAESADPQKRRALEAVADVVTCGATRVDAAAMLAALRARALLRVHCEGGPSLLGSLIAADLLDELCLTTSPALEGGAGPRITTSAGEAIALRAMRLDHVLLAGSMLLTKWSRDR